MKPDESRQAVDLVKRLAAAIRASSLYSPTHPIVNRTLSGLHSSFNDQFSRRPALAIGFLGTDIVVGGTKVRESLVFGGLIRHFQERQVEKLTFSKAMDFDGLRTVISVIADRNPRPLTERLAATGVRGIDVGALSVDTTAPHALGTGSARRIYTSALDTANSLWGAAKAGQGPDPAEAHAIIDTLTTAMAEDRAAMLALTSLKSHDEYTFTHMVNVSLLTMAQARSLGIQGPLLREFGLAGLMHDIGKVRTPHAILNKPDRLTVEETNIMRRHVIDGAQILRRTPEMPALAPIVAFEHHLKQDLSGYPERVGERKLNLCTMLVSIADVFDALRTKRVYRDGLPADRARKMLAEQSGTAFEPTLLRRFISLVGIFPVGTCVRLKTGELGMVTAEHPTDPFRPTVKILVDSEERQLSGSWVIDTSEQDEHGRHPRSVLEAIDTDELGFDPLDELRP